MNGDGRREVSVNEDWVNGLSVVDTTATSATPLGRVKRSVGTFEGGSESVVAVNGGDSAAHRNFDQILRAV